MGRIARVKGAEAFVLFPAEGPRLLAILPTGEVTTSGWSFPRLIPSLSADAPKNGIWDFDFAADPPYGVVLEKSLTITTDWLGPFPEWCRGVRVRAEENDVCAGLEHDHEGRLSQAVIAPANLDGESQEPRSDHAICRRTLCEYQDGFRPTGSILPSSSSDESCRVGMKKLHHRLVLIAEGPDREHIRRGLGQIGASSLMATAASTGAGALQIAAPTILSRLLRHLGDGYAARIEQQSHWIYWDT